MGVLQQSREKDWGATGLVLLGLKKLSTASTKLPQISGDNPPDIYPHIWVESGMYSDITRHGD